jgi:hypothetical protein
LPEFATKEELEDKADLDEGKLVESQLPDSVVRGSNQPAVATGVPHVFNVKDGAFGAKGDGVTNDSPAIQAAINAASVSGGVVFFPPGQYGIAEKLAYPVNCQNPIVLEGATSMGRGGSPVVKLIRLAAVTLLEAVGIGTSGTTMIQGVVLKQLVLSGNSSVLGLVTAPLVKLERCGAGMITDTLLTAARGCALELIQIENWRFDRMTVTQSGDTGTETPAVKLGGTAELESNTNLFSQCIFELNLWTDVFLEGASGAKSTVATTFIGGKWEQSLGRSVHFGPNSRNNHISEPIMYSNHTHECIRDEGIRNSVIGGGIISSNPAETESLIRLTGSAKFCQILGVSLQGGTVAQILIEGSVGNVSIGPNNQEKLTTEAYVLDNRSGNRIGMILAPGSYVFGNIGATVDFGASAAVGVETAMRFRANFLNRWAIYKSNAAETGSNVGADLEFKRYSDEGVNLGVAMKITRSTGAVKLSGPFGANNKEPVTPAVPSGATVAELITALKEVGIIK